MWEIVGEEADKEVWGIPIRIDPCEIFRQSKYRKKEVKILKNTIMVFKNKKTYNC